LFEGAELVVLPPYGGRELLAGIELDELAPYGGGELLDEESVELLPP
jgi:hypothetical protein